MLGADIMRPLTVSGVKQDAHGQRAAAAAAECATMAIMERRAGVQRSRPKASLPHHLLVDESRRLVRVRGSGHSSVPTYCRALLELCDTPM